MPYVDTVDATKVGNETLLVPCKGCLALQTEYTIYHSARKN